MHVRVVSREEEEKKLAELTRKHIGIEISSAVFLRSLAHCQIVFPSLLSLNPGLPKTPEIPLFLSFPSLFEKKGRKGGGRRRAYTYCTRTHESEGGVK